MIEKMCDGAMFYLAARRCCGLSLSRHVRRHSRGAGCSTPRFARPLSADLLLRDGLRLLVDRVVAVGSRRGWCPGAPAGIERSDIGGEVVTRRWHPRRTKPLRGHY